MTPKLRSLGTEATGLTSNAENDGDAGKAPAKRLLKPLTLEQHEMVRLALPMVDRCAAKLARRLRDLLPKEELLAPGTMGLMEAAGLYDPEHHLSFEQFSKAYVFGRMIDAVRTEHFSLRARSELALERGYYRLSGHHDLDVDMFADPEEKLIEGARRGAEDMLVAALLEGAVEADRQGETLILDRLSLAKAKEALLPPERVVIELAYYDGLLFDEVARRVGATVRTVRRRHVSALRKLKAALLR